MSAPATPTADPATDKPPRPNGQIPISLRMFVAILLLVGVGGTLWIVVPAYRQHMAIREIEKLGGWVETETVAPECLRELIGNDRLKKVMVFEKATVVNLFFAKAKDATLAHLSELSNLRVLYIHSAMLTNSGVATLNDMPNLQELYVDGTEVTDSEVAFFSMLKTLRALGLDNTAATDTGLTHLSKLANLEFVSFTSSWGVTKKGIERLGRTLHHCKIMPVGDDDPRQ